MSYIEKAESAIKHAEESLRSLLAEAAAAGDYASVVAIASWGRELARMANQQSAAGGPPGDSQAAPLDGRHPSRLPQLKPTAKREYPRFHREGDRLVRVAWSKRERREYEQRAPYSVLEVLLDAVRRCGVDGRVFGTDEFLPLTSAEGTPIPNYQAYLALAFLKHGGIVDQHGRQGYSAPNVPELAAKADTLWENLPIR